MDTDDNSRIEELKAKDRVSRWLGEIDAALKREVNYRKEVVEIYKVYEAEKCAEYDYNMLYANTDTLLPAMYNVTPRPVVKRRFRQIDPVGLAAAKVGQRMLEFMLDTGSDRYYDFDSLMSMAVLDGLLASRGGIRFKYEGELEAVPDESKGKGATYDKVKSEMVCGAPMPWNGMVTGYAKCWADVPWTAHPHYMTREELEANFGDLGKLVLLETADGTDDKPEDGRQGPPKEANIKTALVWEVLDKATKKQIFVTRGYDKAPLKEVDDPFGLEGVFPFPEPLGFVPRTSSTEPIPLYRMYREQAEELNAISRRINNIVRAIKVRGGYDSNIPALEKILKAGDNEMVPIEGAAALMNNAKGFDLAIWMYPIDTLVAVLQQLLLAREACKQVIYEINGVADIMRGSSNASETLGAQKLKDQWGTLRLKKSQKRVQKYVRDCLRIMLEMGVKRMAIETVKKMTGIDLPMMADKQQTQAAMRQLQKQVAQAQMMAEQAGQQLPPDPGIQQSMQQIQKVLSTPAWEEVMQLLKDDLQRGFRIDIETNSTIDAEATEDKENISELLNAIAQFLNGVAPLIEQGFLPFEAAKGMLLTITRRFRLGDEFEEQLEMMAPPQPKQDPKVEAEKLKMQNEKEKHQMDMQATQQKLENDKQKAAMDMEVAKAKHALEMEKMQLERQEMILKHQQTMEQMQMQALMPPKQPTTTEA